MTVRVVSLVPSATETLLAWDVVPAACTRFCEQPLLPHVGGTKDPDVQAIAALRPDLVVVDREENRKEDAEALAAMGVPLHVMNVTSLQAVPGELHALAGAVGVNMPPVTLPPARADRGTAVAMIWRRPWMALGALPAALALVHRFWREAPGPGYNRLLAWTALTQALYGLLLAMGILAP